MGNSFGFRKYLLLKNSIMLTKIKLIQYAALYCSKPYQSTTWLSIISKTLASGGIADAPRLRSCSNERSIAAASDSDDLAGDVGALKWRVYTSYSWEKRRVGRPGSMKKIFWELRKFILFFSSTLFPQRFFKKEVTHVKDVSELRPFSFAQLYFPGEVGTLSSIICVSYIGTHLLSGEICVFSHEFGRILEVKYAKFGNSKAHFVRKYDISPENKWFLVGNT